MFRFDPILKVQYLGSKYLVGCQGRYNGAKKRCYQGVNGGIWYFAEKGRKMCKDVYLVTNCNTIVTTVTTDGCALFSIANAKVNFLFLRLRGVFPTYPTDKCPPSNISWPQNHTSSWNTLTKAENTFLWSKGDHIWIFLSTFQTYLIIVTDATDAVSVNFSGRCKFLLI